MRWIAIVGILTAVFGTLKADETVFAGGCFWCMQPPFDKTPGVISTTAGYAGGTKPNPTYEEVSAGGTGYIESVKSFIIQTRSPIRSC